MADKERPVGEKPVELVRPSHAGAQPGRPIGGIYCRCGHHDIDHINPQTGWGRGSCAACGCERFQYRTKDPDVS